MVQSALRILIADDEEVVRLFLARVLEDMGLKCDFAVDGKDCVRRFENDGPYDLLFLDLVMPRMDGEETLQAISAAYPDTSIIMLSVQDDEAAIKELLSEGATVYLTKPISADAIREVVNQISEMRSST